MMEIRLEQAKQEQKYRKEMAKRDQEHKEQMALMMEAITSLKRQDGQQSGLRAKKVEMPKLCAFRETQIGTFKAWQESFEGYLILSRAKSECDLQGRRHLVRSAIHPSWQEFWSNGGLKIEQEDDVEVIVEKMYSYLRKKRNVLLDRHLFFQRNQLPTEMVDEYHMKLEALLSQCNYGNKMNAELREEILRDRIISGLSNKETQEKLLEKSLDTLTLASLS